MDTSDFTNLPRELVTSIAQHMAPQDLARFFATSRSLKEDIINREFEETIEKARKDRQDLVNSAHFKQIDFFADAGMIPQKYFIEELTPERELRVVNPRLAPLLKGHFVRIGADVLASNITLKNWFLAYLYQGNLLHDHNKYEDKFWFHLDEALVEAATDLQWSPDDMYSEIEAKNFLSHMLSTPSPYPLTVDDYLQDHFVRFYYEGLYYSFSKYFYGWASTQDPQDRDNWDFSDESNFQEGSWEELGKYRQYISRVELDVAPRYQKIL